MTIAEEHTTVDEEPSPDAPASRPADDDHSSRGRRLIWFAVAVAALALVVWGLARFNGLSSDSGAGARNPIMKWEYLKQSRNVEEIWTQTVQHLKLTVTAVIAGVIIASFLSAIAIRFRWSFTPITVFTGFLYTIPSIALFGVLTTYASNFTSATVALTSYTLLILVRNIVAGIDGVPKAVLDAADGLGMTRRRRLFTVELPLALPVILTGVRVATVTTIGLVGVSFIIQLGGLGSLIFDGYARQFTTPLLIGSVLSVVLAVVLDVGLATVGKVLTPWTRATTP